MFNLPKAGNKYAVPKKQVRHEYQRTCSGIFGRKGRKPSRDRQVQPNMDNMLKTTIFGKAGMARPEAYQIYCRMTVKIQRQHLCVGKRHLKIWEQTKHRNLAKLIFWDLSTSERRCLVLLCLWGHPSKLIQEKVSHWRNSICFHTVKQIRSLGKGAGAVRKSKKWDRSVFTGSHRRWEPELLQDRIIALHHPDVPGVLLMVITGTDFADIQNKRTSVRLANHYLRTGQIPTKAGIIWYRAELHPPGRTGNRHLGARHWIHLKQNTCWRHT